MSPNGFGFHQGQNDMPRTAPKKFQLAVSPTLLYDDVLTVEWHHRFGMKNVCWHWVGGRIVLGTHALTKRHAKQEGEPLLWLCYSSSFIPVKGWLTIGQKCPTTNRQRQTNHNKQHVVVIIVRVNNSYK